MWRLILVSFLLSGCATYQPIVDFQTSTSTPITYKKDLTDCQAYAAQISPELGAVTMGSIGAIFGGVMFGVIGLDVKDGLAIGGLLGAARGASGGAVSQIEIIKKCMRDRGYNVLE